MGSEMCIRDRTKGARRARYGFHEGGISAALVAQERRYKESLPLWHAAADLNERIQPRWGNTRLRRARKRVSKLVRATQVALGRPVRKRRHSRTKRALRSKRRTAG